MKIMKINKNQCWNNKNNENQIKYKKTKHEKINNPLDNYENHKKSM